MLLSFQKKFTTVAYKRVAYKKKRVTAISIPQEPILGQKKFTEKYRLKNDR